jgi:hypothetical protein
LVGPRPVFRRQRLHRLQVTIARIRLRDGYDGTQRKIFDATRQRDQEDLRKNYQTGRPHYSSNDIENVPIFFLMIKLQEISDPMILQPASLDLATLKKKEQEFGFFISPNNHAIHQIAEIKYGSPAHGSTKIEEGDEIVQVNILHCKCDCF